MPEEDEPEEAWLRIARSFADMANHYILFHSLCTVMMNVYQFSGPRNLFGLSFLNNYLNFVSYGEHNVIHSALKL